MTEIDNSTVHNTFLKQIAPVKKEQFVLLVLNAIEFIEANLKSSIQLNDITSELNVSHWEFQRLFKSITGISLGKYLRNRRLTESLKDLHKNPIRVIDVSVEYDFSSQEAYARSFKTYFGMTPIEYKDNPNLVIPSKMDVITTSDIEYFWEGIQRTPEILFLDDIILSGRTVSFKTHFDSDSDCADKVVPHWEAFISDIKNIPDRIPKHELYGVAISSGGNQMERQLNYFASIAVKQPYINHGKNIESMTLPGGLYARFEKKGLAEKFESVVDYIYGIWLSISEYNRRSGYDFEFFDGRYSPNNPDSVSYFYLPITLKKK